MNSAPWIILFAPLLAAAVISIATQPFKKLSSYLSVAAVAVSFFFSLLVFGSSDQDVSFNWIDLGRFQILIGHWFDRPSAADAANKALIVNRIGDFGFMLGILMVWSGSGTVMFDELS